MEGFDLSTIQGCYAGSTPATALYIGSHLIWPTQQHDYSQDYLTFEAITAGTVTITASDSNISKTISYSTDNGTTWADLITSTTEQSFGTFSAGDKILFKGNNSQYGSAYIDQNATIYNYSNQFGGTAQVKIYGNMMSLIYGDNFTGQTSFPSGSTDNFYRLFRQYMNLVDASNIVLPATTLVEGCYEEMFRACYNLTTPPKLPATTLAGGCYTEMFRECTSLTTAPQLPATTLALDCYGGMFQGCTSLTTAPQLPATILTNYCYSGMFGSCTSLTTAPQLPATTLAQECYGSMFQGCTSLTTAPQLPATTLAQECYRYMFMGCTSLTTAPDLPATILVDNCYYNMFNGCTSLNYIKCLATDISATDCTLSWVEGVTSSGSFYGKQAANWTYSDNGIPTGWNVYYIV